MKIGSLLSHSDAPYANDVVQSLRGWTSIGGRSITVASTRIGSLFGNSIIRRYRKCAFLPPGAYCFVPDKYEVVLVVVRDTKDELTR